jgi:hypothetical protein
VVSDPDSGLDAVLIQAPATFYGYSKKIVDRTRSCTSSLFNGIADQLADCSGHSANMGQTPQPTTRRDLNHGQLQPQQPAHSPTASTEVNPSSSEFSFGVGRDMAPQGSLEASSGVTSAFTSGGDVLVGEATAGGGVRARGVPGVIMHPREGAGALSGCPATLASGTASGSPGNSHPT